MVEKGVTFDGQTKMEGVERATGGSGGSVTPIKL
jgi:hypothetical protein